MTKSRNRNKPKARWTPELEDQLRALYPDNTAEIVGEQMGLRLSQIYQKAKALGIQKSDAFNASDKSGRVRRGKQHPNMVAHQIKPGSVPWNKGTHYVAGGRSAETRFKKGRKPEEGRNYVPIGTLRISKDGYLERKMTDDQALFPARRWTFVHRIVWERANGPIPAGHVIAWKPGQRTAIEAEITVDRLECISRAENAQRNSMWRSDPEMMRLHQLKGQITRQVNRIKESQNVQPSY